MPTPEQPPIPTNDRTVFQSLRAFYNARGGLSSVESDYGGYNWDDGHLTECHYCITRPWACPFHRLRVTHVHDTGDFYATLPGQPGPIILVGTLSLNGQPEHQVHHHMGDWAQGPSPGRPLTWFANRIKDWNVHPPDPLPLTRTSLRQRPPSKG